MLCTFLHRVRGGVTCGLRIPERRGRIARVPVGYTPAFGGAGVLGDVSMSCRMRLGLTPTVAASRRSEYPACCAATKASR